MSKSLPTRVVVPRGLAAEVVETGGSLENLARLAAEERAAVGFAQAGVEAELEDDEDLEDLVSRREEQAYWSQPEKDVLRFNDLGVDPLETDTIEARIAGVAEEGELVSPQKVVSGDTRSGTAKKIKFGTARKIRFGTARKIKGEGVPAILGNPPDGFYRRPQGK